MKCEQVKELLSMYLDNELAVEDRQGVACHLHFCAECNAILADFRHFDALLSHLPLVEPQRSLEERIFSSTEYKELTGTWGGYYYGGRGYRSSSLRRLRDDPSRPKLVSLPGGRLEQTLKEAHTITVLPKRRRWLSTVLRFVRIAVTIGFLLALGVSAAVGWLTSAAKTVLGLL
jgi:hypothetical protein